MATDSRSAAISRALSPVGALLFGVGAGAYLHRLTDSWPLVAWICLVGGGVVTLAALVKR